MGRWLICRSIWNTDLIRCTSFHDNFCCWILIAIRIPKHISVVLRIVYFYKWINKSGTEVLWKFLKLILETTRLSSFQVPSAQMCGASKNFLSQTQFLWTLEQYFISILIYTGYFSGAKIVNDLLWSWPFHTCSVEPNKVFSADQKYFLVSIKRFHICDGPVHPVIQCDKSQNVYLHCLLADNQTWWNHRMTSKRFSGEN